MTGWNGTRRRDLPWERRTLDLRGLAEKRVVVIGGTGGIGQALARELATHGAAVTVVGRTFRDVRVAGLDFVAADLSSLVEARRVARQLNAESLDLLLFTTGTMAAKERQLTAEGIERDLAISYLSRHVMLREMAPRLGRTRTAKERRPRVFVWGRPGAGRRANVDDLNSERGYAMAVAHANTVAGNEALVLDAVERYPGIDVFGMNPGPMCSGIRANALGRRPFFLAAAERVIGTVFQGTETYAEAIVPLLVAAELGNRSGAMFDRRGRAVRASAHFGDGEAVSRLVAASEALVKRTVAARRVPVSETTEGSR